MNAINPIPLLTGSVTPTRKSKRSSLIADQESILKAAKLKSPQELGGFRQTIFYSNAFPSVLSSVAVH